MTHKNTFAKSVSALVAAVIAVTAFTREPLRLWLLGIVFAVWGAFLIVRALRNPKPIPREYYDAPYEIEEPQSEVGDWYDSHCKPTLERLATDVRGGITIDENGNIYAKSDGKEVGFIDGFPERSKWLELTDAMTADGYDAFETCGRIAVSRDGGAE
jgi:hypothetical protein